MNPHTCEFFATAGSLIFRQIKGLHDGGCYGT